MKGVRSPGSPRRGSPNAFIGGAARGGDHSVLAGPGRGLASIELLQLQRSGP